MLSISNLPDLSVVGEGTFENLPNLSVLTMKNNSMLAVMNENAFLKSGSSMEEVFET